MPAPASSSLNRSGVVGPGGDLERHTYGVIAVSASGGASVMRLGRQGPNRAELRRSTERYALGQPGAHPPRDSEYMYYSGHGVGGASVLRSDRQGPCRAESAPGR